MKKTMSKTLSFGLAVSMMVGMSTTAFAANPKTYTFDDGSTISFSDVTKVEQVTLTLVEQNYDVTQEEIDANGGYLPMIEKQVDATVVYLPNGATAENAYGYLYGEEDGKYHVVGAITFEGIPENGVNDETFLTSVPDGEHTYKLGSEHHFVSAGDKLFFTTDKLLSDDNRPTDPITPVEPTTETTNNDEVRTAQGDANYTIKQWDTLGNISLNHYGKYDYHQEIYRLNVDVFEKTGGEVVVGMELYLPEEIFEGVYLTPPPTAGANEELYVVKAEDALGTISATELGDFSRYKEIYDMNKNRIDNINMIYAGQILVLPIK